MFLRREGDRITVRSPSKINLSLDVRSRRPDGFHEIETVFAALAFGDDLSFEASGDGNIGLEVSRCGMFPTDAIPADGRNLLVRAAELLRERTGCERGCRIHLWKRVPTEAGLGGGSANAAAAIVALNELWELHLRPERLLELAAEIGSDVAFFVAGHRFAIGRGRGEEIEAIHSPLRHHVLLVKPPSGLSAGSVYREVEPGKTSGSNSVLAVLTGDTPHRLFAAMSNGLEEPALRLNADVRAVRRSLDRELPGRVLMSGSGTTCFGLGRSRRELLGVAGRLRRQRLGEVIVTHTL